MFQQPSVGNVIYFPTELVRSVVEKEREWNTILSASGCFITMSGISNVQCTHIFGEAEYEGYTYG